MAFVTAVHVASVHLVEPARALGDTGLREAALGVLALGARDDIVIPGSQEVVAGRETVIARMVAPERDNLVVGVLASLPNAALVTSGVLEAQVGAAAAVVVVPAAVGDAVVWETRGMQRATVATQACASKSAGPCDRNRRIALV